MYHFIVNIRELSLDVFSLFTNVGGRPITNDAIKWRKTHLACRSDIVSKINYQYYVTGNKVINTRIKICTCFLSRDMIAWYGKKIYIKGLKYCCKVIKRSVGSRLSQKWDSFFNGDLHNWLLHHDAKLYFLVKFLNIRVTKENLNNLGLTS